jgi:hypothetical protein
MRPTLKVAYIANPHQKSGHPTRIPTEVVLKAIRQLPKLSRKRGDSARKEILFYDYEGLKKNSHAFGSRERWRNTAGGVRFLWLVEVEIGYV